MFPVSLDSPFLKACRQKATPYTPIWLMRQAGRYMKEYREVRERHTFLELCKNSDLAAEVTVYAAHRLGVDAAIIFSDILLILEPMGLKLDYVKGDGPQIYNPVRSPADVQGLRAMTDASPLHFVYDAIQKTRKSLKPEIPLIGFSGAPFTLASYMIEGSGSRTYERTKTLMRKHPEAWQELMIKLADSLAIYLQGQIDAGAQALQLFDSWVGTLTPQEYRDFVLPYTKRIFSKLPKDIPVIHFGTQTQHLLELLKEAGGDVIGLDSGTDFADGWKRLGSVGVMGNLDPKILFEDLPTIRRGVERILRAADGRPGHIFNLGHGVLPETPVDHAIALVEMVHEMSQR